MFKVVVIQNNYYNCMYKNEEKIIKKKSYIINVIYGKRT